MTPLTESSLLTPVARSRRLGVTAIVQGRMGSTRLPGKVMRSLQGRPMIDHVLERLGRVPEVSEVVVATSTRTVDDPLARHLQAAGIRVFRGSETDVLGRYYCAALEVQAQVIVRVTADCPLISPSVTGRVVQAYLSAVPPCDYVSNSRQRSYPRGLDIEVFSFRALEKAHREATRPEDREHVTPYIWRQPDVFRLGIEIGEVDRSNLRLTVDTPEDFGLVRRIYMALYPSNPAFDLVDIVELLDQHPDWLALNRHIVQKSVQS